MTEQKLKPCPFCGGKADIDTCYSNNGFFATKTYKVFCQDCLCQTDEEYIKDKAIEAWNKRTSCDTCAMYFPNDGCMASLAEGEVQE